MAQNNASSIRLNIHAFSKFIIAILCVGWLAGCTGSNVTGVVDNPSLTPSGLSPNEYRISDTGLPASASPTRFEVLNGGMVAAGEILVFLNAGVTETALRDFVNTKNWKLKGGRNLQYQIDVGSVPILDAVSIFESSGLGSAKPNRIPSLN